jgi:4-alpha-glucanotransferase
VASEAALRGALAAMGIPSADARSVRASLTDAHRARWARPLPETVVAWEGAPPRPRLRLPRAAWGTPLRYALHLEDGSVREGPCGPPGPAEERAVVDGVAMEARAVTIPESPPAGYHRLRVRAGGARADAFLVVGPSTAADPPAERAWGVFLPVHALHSERSWGVGDLSDLGRLLEWTTGAGGLTVGILPVLASFLDEPYEPSPYSPASRLFWNELYLDVTAAPELAASEPARALLRSRDVRRAQRELRAGRTVDHRAAHRLKRRVLEALSESLFERDSPRRRAFERARTPRLRDYAEFRAAGERFATVWQDWPAAERGGTIAPRSVDPSAVRYHQYAQWLFEEQLSGATSRGGPAGGLLLDLPVGVHASSYDTWRERHVFATGANGGAPPDPFGPAGQDWEFPPLHPRWIAEDGFAYVRDALRHVLRHARVLRIDHVMGLHRMYWIPDGVPASQGVYVRYPAEALYAILCLESRRHGVMVVGEDLGTVPRPVRAAMRRRGLRRTFVGQFELSARPARAVSRVPPRAMASVNTHDMPPFAAFWTDADLEEREALGLLSPAARAREVRRRRRLRPALAAFLGLPGAADAASAGTARAVLRGFLEYLGSGDADLVQAGLEDLWGETRPQNMPGTTGRERLNWSGRARYPLERLMTAPDVLRALRALDAARRGPVDPRAAGRRR